MDRGDIAKLPFSDDVGPESRLLMRRNVRATRRGARAVPHVRRRSLHGPARRRPARVDDGCVHRLGPLSLFAAVLGWNGSRVNYLRNSVKVVIDAYDGSTAFYVFDTDGSDHRRVSRALSDALQGRRGDAGRISRAHVRYPELLLALQADVYGLYHMTNPEVFYNREDLWTVATDGGHEPAARRRRPRRWSRTSSSMKLPGETRPEFVEMPAVLAGQSQQPDRMDRRTERRRALRRRRSSTTFPRSNT